MQTIEIEPTAHPPKKTLGGQFVDIALCEGKSPKSPQITTPLFYIVQQKYLLSLAHGTKKVALHSCTGGLYLQK